MDFERFLREFLAHGSLVGWLGAVAMALYGVGYFAFSGKLAPAWAQGALFGCIALWLISAWSYRRIFGKLPGNAPE